MQHVFGSSSCFESVLWSSSLCCFKWVRKWDWSNISVSPALYFHFLLVSMFQRNLSKNLSFWCRNELFLPQIQESKKHKWIWGYVRVRVSITIFSYPQNFPKIFLGSQKFFGEYQRFFPCPRKIENATCFWVVLLFWECVVEFIIVFASNESENETDQIFLLVLRCISIFF